VSAAPFRRLLVANRGEIAIRIMRACRELGIESVAVYSDADATSLHVRAADMAVRIGPAPAGESYLRGDRILQAALEAEAQAVHPGYGFLSEQTAFATACEAAGLVFVGPSPETLASLGDKLQARRSAAAAGVPITPGTFEPLPVDGSPEALSRVAATAAGIGYPLLVKASAGGGGRGMRRVDEPEELASAVTAAAREAASAFGDGAVYLERYVEGACHVEVQLIGDAQGQIVALGERDCSTQRRHQKLLEEAPAPGLSADQRRSLHSLAVSVARTVGLRNAATAEFLLDREGHPAFLEVNARLQVEHGVTELVTGLDLVREQLFIAAGQPLSAAVLAASAAAAVPTVHAIEARISAEDPSRDFAPSPGRLSRWREPGGPGVRIDSGVEAGTLVSGEYDPLLAKLLVVAPDRDQAIARLSRALEEWETGGVQTTLPFHRWLVRHPAFRDAELRTDLVARDWDPAPLREAAARQAALAVASAVGGRAPGVTTGMREADGGAGVAPEHASPTDGWTAAARREAVDRWQ
jgi:acetyl/propionyl-CoA carboxylase alpha subunit